MILEISAVIHRLMFYVLRNRKYRVVQTNITRQDLPDKSTYLGEEYKEIPLSTTVDLSFLAISWLLKSFKLIAEDSKKRYYNLKFNSA